VQFYTKCAILNKFVQLKTYVYAAKKMQTVNSLAISSAVWIQYTSVSGGQTDRNRPEAVVSRLDCLVRMEC